ncbi:MAG: hypothetical protein PVF83_01390 [Anaerolineales bacterium]|jgi:hypothetical protein
MPVEHKLLKFILPAALFKAVREDTKNWLLACPCGHIRDLWDAGGVRYKAVGEPRQYRKCPACGRRTWQNVRKKTDIEKQQLLS